MIFALKFQSGIFGTGLFKVEGGSTAIATADWVEHGEDEQNGNAQFSLRNIQDIKKSIMYGL